MSEVICKRCDSSHTTRATRKNFFQQVILLRLGLHPWRCTACKSYFLSRNRGPRKQSHRDNLLMEDSNLVVKEHRT
jgi:hypothetical protein